MHLVFNFRMLQLFPKILSSIASRDSIPLSTGIFFECMNMFGAFFFNKNLHAVSMCSWIQWTQTEYKCYCIVLDGGGELSGVQYKSQMINTLCSTKYECFPLSLISHYNNTAF